jgi:hypothetical protein
LSVGKNSHKVVVNERNEKQSLMNSIIKRPNLFGFATKELSQDAFIAWLLQWASPECQNHDALLNNCARRFVTKLLSLQTKPPQDITIVKAGRQWENIDVWAEINEKHLLIIEDKTFTREHSNQLQTYRERATAWCAENSFQLVCVYLKTGSESAAILENIKQQGFAVFGRRAFLDILNTSDVTNHIFIDFKEHLQDLEDAEIQFLKKPIKEWGDPDWKGFYQGLESLRPVVNWGYVPTPLGGFWNAVLNWHELKDCCPYIQIEQGLLCFKVGDVTENQSEIRNHYHSLFMAHCVGKTEIRKPYRFGKGVSMTIAVVDPLNWLGGDDSLVDMNEVVGRLNHYEALYSEMIVKWQSEETGTRLASGSPLTNTNP